MDNLCIPVYNRPDLLDQCIASIDVPLDRLLIIDNSAEAFIGRRAEQAAEKNPLIKMTWVVYPLINMGVAASWNFAISQTRNDVTFIANADTVFGEGDLEALEESMLIPGPRWIGMNGDWRVFGINRVAVETVGWFDTNFHPIYCEDCDYERRCTLGGVTWGYIFGTTTHTGSVSWQDHDLARRENNRTYAENRAYYERKWGGPPRGGERFATPFDEGGSLDRFPIDLARIDRLDWHEHYHG